MRSLPARASAAAALTGAAVVAVGCALPWYSTYAGLHVARGTGLTSGRLELLLAAVLLAAGLAGLLRPGRRSALLVLAAAGLVTLVAAYLAAAMLGALSAFRQDAFLFGRGGPGVWVVVGGAVLALAAGALGAARPGTAGSAVAGPATTGPAPAATPVARAAAALLAGAGLVHLAVAPEHLAEWAVYGVFFAVLGAGQLVAAVVALQQPSRSWWLAVAVGSAAVVVLWAVTRTTGLPVGPEPFSPEEVGVADVFSSLVEAATAVLALRLARPSRRPAGQGRAARIGAAVVPVAVAVTTLVAVLAGTGALSAGSVHVH